MTSYEDDHNLPRTTSTPTRRARPALDLDSLFSSSLPSAASASEAFRALASTYSTLSSTLSSTHTPLLSTILSTLASDATSNVAVSGVPDGFTDTLERVPKNRLKDTDTCPICNTAFLEDKFPLVVRLPCHRWVSTHIHTTGKPPGWGRGNGADRADTLIGIIYLTSSVLRPG
jgi:hypothetical protein